MLTLDYSKDDRRVFIPLKKVNAGIYERAIWDRSEQKEQKWEGLEEKVIYLLTGLEMFNKRNLDEVPRRSLPHRFPVDSLHPSVLLL